MQKALILALLIGAFLLPRYLTAQEAILPDYHCPDGGTLRDYGGQMVCSVPAPSGQLYRFDYGIRRSSVQAACDSGAAGYLSSTQAANSNPAVNWHSPSAQLTGSEPTYSCKMTIQFTGTRPDGSTYSGQSFYTDNTVEIYPSSPYCPPDNASGFASMGGTAPDVFCWQPAVIEEQDCPTEPGPNPIFYIGQQGGGTACIEEDNGSICPYVEDPNTPGYYTADFSNPQSCAGQQPEEPDLKPDCTEGGNGMTVCKADPDEKCTVNSTGLLSCEANCGYINGQFYCPEEPDVPELPDPEIEDDIQDPNKPMGDMVKQDFKDVLVGAETRLSSIKKELEDVQLRNDKNTDKLSDKLTGIGAKIDQVNRNLVGIQGTLDETLYGDELTIDSSGFQDEINQGLGVTGDESLEDLEGEPISLDDFSGNFQFSLGSSACPADRQINIRGKAQSISWQPFCDVFSFIGVLVQISAYVLSLFIVFGGRK